MYSWSKDFPTLTELFFGKEEVAEVVEEVKDPADDIPEVMTEEL